MVDGPNMYAYSLNDPVNAVDLYGTTIQLVRSGIHGFIRIVNNPKYNTALGFNPAEKSSVLTKIKVLAGWWVPGQVYDETNTPVSEVKTVVQDNSKDELVYNMTRFFIPQKYNFYYLNCYDWRQYALKLCGIDGNEKKGGEECSKK